MKKEILLSLSIIILGVSVIVGSYLIEKGLIQFSRNINNGLYNLVEKIENQRKTEEKDIMTLEEASDFLRIDKRELVEIISDRGSGIPYLQINGKVIIHRQALDTWLKTTKYITN